MNDMIDTVSIAIAFIAGISLLVGGIGVMNIMLVSITERTREIGTRKALGAKNSSIRLQFIIEAGILCLLGGVFGIILGFILGAVAASLLGYAASAPVAAIIGSVVFSMIIGVFFGYYPANKAARLDPIEALRYEKKIENHKKESHIYLYPQVDVAFFEVKTDQMWYSFI